MKVKDSFYIHTNYESYYTTLRRKYSTSSASGQPVFEVAVLLAQQILADFTLEGGFANI